MLDTIPARDNCQEHFYVYLIELSCANIFLPYTAGVTFQNLEIWILHVSWVWCEIWKVKESKVRYR